MANLITRTVASQMLSLFDYAFKKGVLDAADMRDEYYCTEFIRKRESTVSYGTLDNPYDMDWKEWKLTLNRWCAMGRLAHLYQNFIGRINRPGYLMVVLPITQDFYVMGIKEWLEYSNPRPLEVFRTQSKVHWKPIDGKTMSKIKNDNLVTLAQEFAYNRSHRVDELEDLITPKAYEVFGLELWKMTRPIPKVVIEDDF